MSYLKFKEAANPGKKTKHWTIHNSDGDVLLGCIEFHAPWRKYVWTMAQGVIFDVKCTQVVIDFLNVHAEDRNG